MENAISQKFGNSSIGSHGTSYQGVFYQTFPPPRQHYSSVTKTHSFRPALNGFFIGRGRDLDAVKNAFKHPAERQKVFVVLGMGGIGKSELCVKFVNDMEKRYWGIFWIDVSDVNAAESNFKDIARQINPDEPVDNLEEALRLIASVNFEKHPWLLILDNADDLKVDYRNYLPRTCQGHVLITSRNSECRNHNTVGSLELGALDHDEATDLLLNASNVLEQDWPTNREEARKVVDFLGSHTLALIQAGAFISTNGTNWTDYRSLFEEHRAHLLKTSFTQAQSRLKDCYATFEVSAKSLETNGDQVAGDALNLLAILSTLHHSHLPESVLEQALKGFQNVQYPDKYELNSDHISSALRDEAPTFIASMSCELRLRPALGRLASLSLVKRSTFSNDGKMVSMHPLVHAWAGERLTSGKKKEAWIRTASVIVLSTKAPQESVVYSDYSRPWLANALQLRPHIDSFTDHLGMVEPSDWPETILLQIVFTIIKITELIGHITQDFNVLSEALSRLAETYGPCELPILRVCAEVHLKLGNLSKASHFLELCKNIEAASDVPTADRLLTTNGTAKILHKRKKHSEAISLLENALSEHEAKLPKNHPYLLEIKYMLVSAYKANLQMEKALSLMNSVIENLPKAESSRLTAIRKLASIYCNQAKIPKAIEIMEKVVWTSEKQLPGYHPDLIFSRYDLARLYFFNAQYRQSLELFKQVDQFQRQMRLQQDAPRLLIACWLVALYMTLGERDKIRDHFEELITEPGGADILNCNNRQKDQDPISWLWTAWVYHYNGQEDQFNLDMEASWMVWDECMEDAHASVKKSLFVHRLLQVLDQRHSRLRKYLFPKLMVHIPPSDNPTLILWVGLFFIDTILVSQRLSLFLLGAIAALNLLFKDDINRMKFRNRLFVKLLLFWTTWSIASFHLLLFPVQKVSKIISPKKLLLGISVFFFGICIFLFNLYI